MMHTTAFEVIKEYVFPIAGLSYVIKGRISTSLNPDSAQPFTWEISHRWRKSDAQGFYYPSSVSAATFDEAKTQLFMYARGLAGSGVVITPDTHY